MVTVTLFYLDHYIFESQIVFDCVHGINKRLQLQEVCQLAFYFEGNTGIHTLHFEQIEISLQTCQGLKYASHNNTK